MDTVPDGQPSVIGPLRFSFVADHFQYLASIGLIALAAALICRLSDWRRWLAPAIGGLFLVILGTLTWRQTRIYADLETVFLTLTGRSVRNA